MTAPARPTLPRRAPRTLDQLVARFGLSARQRDQLAALVDALARDEHAPTTVRDPEQSVPVHIADSLTALEIGALRTKQQEASTLGAAVKIADLGSGAGFPGLPLAIARPDSQVSLVEAGARKCAFLARALAAAEVGNATVVCRRIEDWADAKETQDVVVTRALDRPAVVLEYGAPLLAVGGLLIDWRGRRDEAEEARADAAGRILGLTRTEVVHVFPYPGARDHYLHLYLKVRDTPERFPRRVGSARKRPLGGSTRS